MKQNPAYLKPICQALIDHVAEVSGQFEAVAA